MYLQTWPQTYISNIDEMVWVTNVLSSFSPVEGSQLVTGVVAKATRYSQESVAVC